MASARVVSLSIINAILSVFGSCMTILVILVIQQNTELQKGLNLLIVSLTVADLVNCLIAQPMYIYYLSNDNGSTSYLTAFQIIAFIGLHAVFLNLTTITYHRMKALARLFHHLLLVSQKKYSRVHSVDMGRFHNCWCYLCNGTKKSGWPLRPWCNDTHSACYLHQNPVGDLEAKTRENCGTGGDGQLLSASRHHGARKCHGHYFSYLSWHYLDVLSTRCCSRFGGERRSEQTDVDLHPAVC